MPTATEPTTAAAAPSSVKKLPHKIYTVAGQRRALFTLGAGRNCTLMDVPAALFELAASGCPTTDSYVVEQGLRPRADGDQLQALLADYLAQAKRHQAVPMTVFALTASLEAYAAAT